MSAGLTRLCAAAEEAREAGRRAPGGPCRTPARRIPGSSGAEPAGTPYLRSLCPPADRTARTEVVRDACALPARGSLGHWAAAPVPLGSGGLLPDVSLRCAIVQK
ncbi:hypothetical protein GCM10010327_61190 [Streptomyces nitrosporeus]|nr:hypothetical protein GCM10010327_61190 [Streptomyces nitrosporeus]